VDSRASEDVMVERMPVALHFVDWPILAH